MLNTNHTRPLSNWQSATGRKGTAMKRPSLMLLLVLAAGCASRTQLPADSAATASAVTTSRTGGVSGLRPFYLLSPGPNATLVVTRSELPER